MCICVYIYIYMPSFPANPEEEDVEVLKGQRMIGQTFGFITSWVTTLGWILGLGFRGLGLRY